MNNKSAVLCPPATSPYLWVNLASIYISKTMCVTKYLDPGFAFLYLVWSCVTPFKNSKATRTLAKCMSRLLVNFVCLVNCLRNLNPKLMWCSPVFFFKIWDISVLFVKKILHPTFKGRSVLYLVSYFIFRKFNRVWGFDILHWYPAYCSIIPFDF